ncbi:RagB/SusD family nutrient uptake outer membrane protein [Alkalitalea saponilacus]|uniref:Starch-binding associating with outer membrane n=1 Tax=Alkalitalea saponilacus TaxID=889453 RepID=A0A1T5EVJ5_9BACT|nr:RagB/SusD family nutrient uptake outer membrane protein [Alkalitalea saponilacus]ASB48020.1 RagB/SusD family protein [Alkalitalea saponilacus]SKB87740.1 Starch-binding associating with outer membrane [Alkalitalea saponilacus]
MKRIKIIFGAVLTSIFILGLSGCKDLLEVEPDDVLTDGQFYRDIYDADAAIRGLYGKLIDLAPQYVILNELRADLMDVTFNSDHYLREIANHEDVSNDNPWVNPAPFFSLINDCNSVISNFKTMLEKNRISREAYEPRVSDAIALRSWLYMQLAIHYGEVPYITQSIEKVDDLSKIERGEFPVLGIEEMMAVLLTEMESVPYKGIYTDESLFRVIDGFHTRTMFIDKEYLLGELHLWNGNYVAAASYFKSIMERSAGYNPFDQYKLPYRDNAQPANPGTSRYTSGYLRFFDEDLNSVVNFWPMMFQDYGTANYFGEWLWVMYFHQDYKPSPFFDLFSYQNGEYLLQPSQKIIDDWNSQIQGNQFTGDFRGSIEDIFENKGSYDMIGGNPVITKYIAEYDDLNSLSRPGKWFLWRAGSLHLRYVEAANRAGQHFLAWTLLNNGVRANYPGSDRLPGHDFTHRNVSYLTDAFGNIIYDLEINGNDTTFYMTNLSHPFDFDARQTTAAQIPPLYRGDWHRGIGVRGRVSLSNLVIGEDDPVLERLEDYIIDESARELAFEGQRWADLVRIAIRRGDNGFLANKIAERFEAVGDYGSASRVREKLMVRENWFLPIVD